MSKKYTGPRVGESTGQSCPICGKPVMFTAMEEGDIESGPMGLAVYNPEICRECLKKVNPCPVCQDNEVSISIISLGKIKAEVAFFCNNCGTSPDEKSTIKEAFEAWMKNKEEVKNRYSGIIQEINEKCAKIRASGS